MTGKCEARVWNDFSHGPCGNKAKYEIPADAMVAGRKGKVRVCGTHKRKYVDLPAERKQKRREERERADGLKAQSDKRIAALAALGVNASAHYRPGYGSSMGTYTGGVVLSREQADELIERLRGT